MADTLEELPEEPAPKKSSSGGSLLVPTIVMALISAGVSFLLFKMVILPGMQEGGSGDSHGEVSHDSGHGGESHGTDDGHDSGHAKKIHEYPMDPITTNLSSEYKSRLIKIQFTLAGTDPKFEKICESNVAKLKDATFGELQALTLQDVQDPGVRNTIKHRLLNSFEKALNGRTIEQIYITDMVIQ